MPIKKLYRNLSYVYSRAFKEIRNHKFFLSKMMINRFYRKNNELLSNLYAYKFFNVHFNAILQGNLLLERLNRICEYAKNNSLNIKHWDKPLIRYYQEWTAFNSVNTIKGRITNQDINKILSTTKVSKLYHNIWKKTNQISSTVSFNSSNNINVPEYSPVTKDFILKFPFSDRDSIQNLRANLISTQLENEKMSKGSPNITNFKPTEPSATSITHENVFISSNQHKITEFITDENQPSMYSLRLDKNDSELSFMGSDLINSFQDVIEINELKEDKVQSSHNFYEPFNVETKFDISDTIEMNQNILKINFNFFNASSPISFTAQSGSVYTCSMRVLGQGTYGQVYLGIQHHTGQFVALKLLPFPSEEEEREKLLNEMAIMQSLRDPHIVTFIDYCLFNNNVVFIMECVVPGCLGSIISNFNKIDVPTAKHYIFDILQGLNQLHLKGIVHRDIKPHNVLITSSGTCKLADFGVSAFLVELSKNKMKSNTYQNEVVGTPVYMAPESICGTVSVKGDVWSIGIMFLELITGTIPYKITEEIRGNPILFVTCLSNGTLVPSYNRENFSKTVLEFIDACLATNPDNRLSVEDLLDLPLFS